MNYDILTFWFGGPLLVVDDNGGSSTISPNPDKAAAPGILPCAPPKLLPVPIFPIDSVECCWCEGGGGGWDGRSCMSSFINSFLRRGLGSVFDRTPPRFGPLVTEKISKNIFSSQKVTFGNFFEKKLLSTIISGHFHVDPLGQMRSKFHWSENNPTHMWSYVVPAMNFLIQILMKITYRINHYFLYKSSLSHVCFSTKISKFLDFRIFNRTIREYETSVSTVYSLLIVFLFLGF